jgi:ABC-type phosphate transport system substrate-binding protein
MSARQFAAAVLVWFLVTCFALPVAAQNLEVAVVVNPNNPVANLTTVELRKIFAGEKHSWPRGLSIKLIVRSTGCHERLALLKLLGMSESDYKQYWAAEVFRGDASSEPVAVFSNGMQKEAVAAIPGAIALINTQDLKPGVKVVKVEGHLPGEAGYPLH